MKFVSTRGGAAPVPFSEAMRLGLAPDGGLYVPERWPEFYPGDLHPRESLDAPEGWRGSFAGGFHELDAPAGRRGSSIGDLRGHENYPELAARVLAPFLAGDVLEEELGAICRDAFSFPVPLVFPTDAVHPGRRAAVLELFHGPTAAFKDLGARFMAACFQRLDAAGEGTRTILVATSGDTGGAVAAAFHGRPGTEVVILFPEGGVSGRQEKQLTAWGGNVRAFSVRGTFDDCQRMLKEALADEGLRATHGLTTANSINLARILPQIVHYAFASLAYRRRNGTLPHLVIPAGNVGNSVVALWARRMGFPLGRITLAANANRTVPDYLARGRWEPRPSVKTLANAMDVGDPSNMERVFALYPSRDDLAAVVDAESVGDEAIRETIARGPARWGRVWDPHTATAVRLVETRNIEDAVIVATAHPAKFETVVEPLIGRAVEAPASLRGILERPSRVEAMEPSLDALLEELKTR